MQTEVLKMTKAERRRNKHDKAKLQRQLMKLSKVQRALARGLLHKERVFNYGNVAAMIEYAGEPEVTNVLLEAAWSVMPLTAHVLAKLLAAEEPARPETLEIYSLEMEQLRLLGWLIEGIEVLIPLVVPFVRERTSQDREAREQFLKEA